MVKLIRALAARAPVSGVSGRSGVCVPVSSLVGSRGSLVGVVDGFRWNPLPVPESVSG